MLALMITGSCVTINVYFPAASAEKAAEKFVGDVLGEPQKDGSLLGPEDPRSGSAFRLVGEILDYLVPSAQAQQAEIDINTPQINAIKARMAQRQRESLNAFFVYQLPQPYIEICQWLAKYMSLNPTDFIDKVRET